MEVNFTKSKLFDSFRQLTRDKWALGATIFSGKILGLFIVIIAMMVVPGLISSPAHAADTYTAHETSMVNTVNTIWTLVAAFLVFGMQAGFVMLEAGFARKRETVNILMECIFDTCLCGILFWAIGYAFMFGSGNGFIGWGGADGKNWFFLQNTPLTYGSTGIPVLAHWIFQYAFADTCSTIVSGAMIGRTSFRGDILYSIGITGFIYPILGHWAWGPDGWLVAKGFLDFAGSTVVHTIGGIASLAGALVLGPRLGRIFKRDGGGMPPAHNLTIAAVGGFLLWFGWYGFNPGSTLSAMDGQGIGRVAANTTLAACAGGIVAMYLALWFGDTKGKFDVGFTVNGFLAGLVAITASCYWVSPLGAILLGAISGVIVYYGTQLLEYFRIDDPVGAVPVHGLNGIWGTLSIGFFACGKYGFTGPTGPDDSKPITGLFYGGGTEQLMHQVVGSASITFATLAIAGIMMFVIGKLPYPWRLRVEEHGELMKGGIDVFEHGASAYTEQEDEEVSLNGLFESGVKAPLA
jgi:Amt family ammonium transporter